MLNIFRINKNSSGYISLAYISILFMVLFVVLLFATFKTYFLSQLISDQYYKKQSFALAKSCANIALFNYFQSRNYIGNIRIKNMSCSIINTQKIDSFLFIETKSNFNNNSTSLKLKYDLENNSIISLEETLI